MAWGAAQYGLDEPTHWRVAAFGETPVTLAAVDLEIAPARTFCPPAGTAVILRQLIGLGALSIGGAIVPLLAARAILGAIIAFLQTGTKANP